MSDQREDDFATLFAASGPARRFVAGQAVEGTIVRIGAEVVLVDVGAKGEAALDAGEIKGEDGKLEAQVGDRIQATVVSTAGGITLSRRLQRGAASLQRIEAAWRAGLPVEGRVDGQVKGGYHVTVAKHRAFCPLSQIDAARTADPAVHEGQTYTFRIIEFGEGGRTLVVSRRAILEQEQQARSADVRNALAVGSIVTGRVVNVRDFGAFIDLGGGVQGLLHISELAWTRVARTSDVVAPGQEIAVKVLRVDDANGRIALGLKQLVEPPAGEPPAAQESEEAADLREYRQRQAAAAGPVRGPLADKLRGALRPQDPD